MGGRHEERERYYERRDIDAWLTELDRRFAGGVAAAVEDAPTFLDFTTVTLPWHDERCGWS